MNLIDYNIIAAVAARLAAGAAVQQWLEKHETRAV